MSEIKHVFSVSYGKKKIGRIDVAESGKYRWTTEEEMPEKAPELLEHHMAFGIKEGQWQDPYPFFASRINGMLARGMDRSGSASDDFELVLER